MSDLSKALAGIVPPTTREEIAEMFNLRRQAKQVLLSLPEGWTLDQWAAAGEVIGSFHAGIGWLIGEWWLYDGPWDDITRLSVVGRLDWSGPRLSTCHNAAQCCRKFPKSRRRDSVPYSHHLEVVSLPDADAEELLDWCEETIAETGEPRSVRELRNRKRELSRVAHVANLQFPEGRYGLIYCDPPWQYDFSLTDTRKIENQYPTMTQEELLAFPMAEKFASDNAMIFMWAVSPRLPQALELMAGWGFGYVTNMVWVKDKIGMGYHARAQHELLLIGRRGNVPPPAPENRFSSVIFGERSEHSRKPTEAYVRVEEGYPSLPKIEVFARNDRPGWTSWGNQLLALTEAAE